MNNFSTKLDNLKSRGRYRSLVLPCGVDLTSNDYLGLAEDSFLRDAAAAFLHDGGQIGAGGSRLLRGHTDAHASLEDYAAGFFKAPRSLFFASGYQANMAIFQALPTRHDVIIFDEFVHASAREGIQNSPATHVKFPHNDMDALELALKNAAGAQAQVWVAVESVYSMDGDVVPIERLYGLIKQYDAYLILDEAHGVGVCGDTGRGVSEELIDRVGYERLIVLHTCGKALGVAGGLVCASDDVIEMMINCARGFIYSTAPMPLQAHLVQQALVWLRSAEGTARRDYLRETCAHGQVLFGGAGTHIVPIIIGDDARAVEIAETLQAKGWDIRAIRPPSVPEGTARLRLSLSAALDTGVLDAFAADYKNASQKLISRGV